MSNGRCLNCKWMATMNNVDAGSRQMECRLNPPSVFPAIGQDDKGNTILIKSVSINPPVSHDHWCSHHQAGIQIAINPAHDVQ